MSAPVIQSALFQETLTELETITRVLNAKPKVYPRSVDALEDRQRRLFNRVVSMLSPSLIINGRCVTPPVAIGTLVARKNSPLHIGEVWSYRITTRSAYADIEIVLENGQLMFVNFEEFAAKWEILKGECRSEQQ